MDTEKEVQVSPLSSEMSLLSNIKIVLVATSHSGNIGSAARAMKVMGLSKMVLVAPQCEVDAQTVALSAGASEIATNAQIVETLSEAVADCCLVVGSSARARSLNWPMLETRECGELLLQEAINHPVALVFGREKTGLTNEELQKCHYHVAIPSNPDYSSLNLAMAVQTLCYEVRMAYLQHQERVQSKRKNFSDDKNRDEDDIMLEDEHDHGYPSHHELEMFYHHLENVLHETQFISRKQPGLVMNKLRRLFTRARPKQTEINMLRGVLTAMEKNLPPKQLLHQVDKFDIE